MGDIHASPKSKAAVINDVPSKLKLTILNLSGIHIKESSSSHKGIKRNQPTSDAAITASISFTGSCDPNNMRVVSSNICPISGRICVESRPVVIPYGMTDGLVAIWDDTPESSFDKYGSLESGKENGLKGSILAEPKARPHLYVDLEGNMNDEECNDLLMTPTGLTALSTLPSDDDSSNISSLSKVSSLDKEFSPTKPSDLIVESTSPLIAKDLKDHSDNRFALINTPLDTNDTSSIPEILELNLALHINQIPKGNGDCSDSDVKSKCPPCLEGGGAIAHLVLFPDIFSRDSSREENDDFESGDGWRILEVPVRKRDLPYLSSSSSALSGLTSAHSAIQGNNISHHKVEMGFDYSTWIDLEDNATIRLRLEECKEEDDFGLSEAELKQQYFKAMPIDYSLHDISEDAEVLNRSKKIDSDRNKSRGNAEWKEGVNEVDSSKNLNSYCKNEESNIDENSRQPQAEINDADNDAKLIPGSLYESSSGDKQTQRSLILCSNGLTLEDLFDTMTGIVGRCGEKVAAVNFDARSMDSTICTVDMKR